MSTTISAEGPSGVLFPFGFQGKVTRRDYFLVGVLLMAFKYLVEASVIYGVTQRLYTPIDFVNPLLSSREYFSDGSTPWLGMAWILWTLPFFWIAVAMSVRRSVDMGRSPWLGLLVLVPIVNWVGMFLFSVLPSKSKPAAIERSTTSEGDQDAKQVAEAFRAPVFSASKEGSNPRLGNSSALDGVVSAIAGIGGGTAYAIAMVVLSVSVLGSYGASMFFGTPLVTGAVAAYMFNRRTTKSAGLTLGHSVLTISTACFGFLAFGIEGIICIVMAIPIMIPIGILGAFIGRAIAMAGLERGRDERMGMIGCMLLLPFVSAIEYRWQPSPTFEVMTCLEIDAPPDIVWKKVIDFPEITAKEEWFFAMGIASPKRARIDGQGVGAIRHCEFSTGAFVEPITVWNPPMHLAFDVTEQPEPMYELTPYRNLHPPHLDHSFRSTKGEFRLIDLGNRRTRLEGRTWYQLEIHPLSYWTLWTDWVIHRIHLRVLRHIETIAESEAQLEPSI